MDVWRDNVAILIGWAGGQVELGEAVGVSQGTISRWKKGGKPKDVGSLSRVAKYAKVAPDALMAQRLSRVERQPIAAPGSLPLMMQVQLPSVEALTDMFVGMFETAGRPDLADELAPRLAERLPDGLARAQGHLAQMQAQTVLRSPDEGVRPPATDRP